MNITAYLAAIGGVVLISFLWFGVSWNREGGKNAGILALLTGFLCVLLGLVCAKATYLLLRINTLSLDRLGEAILRIQPDELSYYGGAAGICLALWLSAKMLGESPRQVMNAFAPMGAFMAAGFRFAEGFLGMLGTGMYLEYSFFPVAVEISWGDWKEYYLAVFMLEGIMSLIAMVLSLRHKGETYRFLRTLFYLCLPQILCESLRSTSIAWLFVRAEMLFCYLLCEGVFVWYAFKADRKQLKSWVPAIVGLVACGVVITAQFAIDGKIAIGNSAIPQWICYAVEIAALAAMAVAEHKGYRAMNNEQ